MKIKAIIFGATGMVGEGVLHQALKDPDVESVLVIGRRSCGVKHRKLTELIHDDFHDYSTIEERIKGYHACFFCLGVSSIGMSEKAYRRITYDLTLRAATTLSRLNPGMSFCYISGAGTDSSEKGPVMWLRVKGMTENHLMKLPFKAVYLFRPAFIKPMKGLRHAHAISSLAVSIYPILKFLAPKWICTLEEVGIAMIRVVTSGYSARILENEDIVRLAGANAEG